MKLAAALFAGILLVLPATAQKLDLKFADLAAKAKDKAEMDLDGAMLKMALKAASLDSKDDKDKKALPGLLRGVQQIHVRHYEFENTGAWSDKDLESVRRQVSSTPGWSRIINVKDKGENVEVYVLTQGDNLGGALILAAEDTEFTVVHLEGTITLAEMKGMVDSQIAFNLGGLDILDTMRQMSK
jgi:hypothetical protein